MARSSASPKELLLYDVDATVTVRVPALPVQFYTSLIERVEGASDASLLDDLRVGADEQSVFMRAALAVASPSLFTRFTAGGPLTAEVRRKVLRYLVRAATRPTPFGMFAGVALGRFGDATTVSRSNDSWKTHSRPDTGWVAEELRALEAQPAVRQQVRLVANSTYFEVGGRFVLARSEAPGSSKGVSVRATNVCRLALTACRQPAHYQEVKSRLLATIPGATPAKVDTLIGHLIDQTFILTDLRLTPAGGRPSQDVLARVARVESQAAEQVTRVEELTAATSAWDDLPMEARPAAYLALVQRFDGQRRAHEEGTLPAAVAQVDSSFGLAGATINHSVGREVVLAAQALFAMSADPGGPRRLNILRDLFVERYGFHREVPLLEAVDPQAGIDLDKIDVPELAFGAADKILIDLAMGALARREISVRLDPATLRGLTTADLVPARLPRTLDVHLTVAARSAQAVDAGDFRIVLQGTATSSAPAGAMLGRFATMLGADARVALERLAARDAALHPGHRSVEIAHIPDRVRYANVLLRPNVRDFEASFGTWPSSEVPSIPLDELVVGVGDERFYVRWPRADTFLDFYASHVLNMSDASKVARFLWMVGMDGHVRLAPFAWGAAARLPFLPRVELGRVVLSLAEWSLEPGAALVRRANEAHSFAEALQSWRSEWSVPRDVALVERDNRLQLDLESRAGAEELRQSLLEVKEKPLKVQEVLPTPEECWLRGPGGTYASELVVSLTRREPSPPPAAVAEVTPWSLLLRPPGSDWLYVKLYVNPTLEADVLASEVKELLDRLPSTAAVDRAFFIRFRDPDPHLRLRFHGGPERLLGEALPHVVAWATQGVQAGRILRFAFDTYEREVDRYGGRLGIDLAEEIFSADSRAVLHLLALLRGADEVARLDAAVVSASLLVRSLIPDDDQRLDWLRTMPLPNREGATEYRARSGALRELLKGDAEKLAPEKAAIRRILHDRSRQLEGLAPRLSGIATAPRMTHGPNNFCASVLHMHANRFFGIDRESERKTLGMTTRLEESIQALRKIGRS